MKVAMAGGKGFYNGVSSPNSSYYLYNSKYFWTFSPSRFNSYASSAGVYIVASSGAMNSGIGITNSAGVRPVINLKANTLITKGDGSSLNPFTIN